MVLKEKSGRIGIVTLDRPEKRNALSAEMVSELKKAFGDLISDKNVKVIILKANGDAFCAGADLAYIKQLQKNTYQENLADSQNLRQLFQMIYESPKIVIAQVEGPAIAGGAGLASICDFIFAVPDLKMAYTEVKIGFIPALVMVFLLRKINECHAKYLLLSGEMIGAEQALNWGIINEIVDTDKMESRVMEFAERLVKRNSENSMAVTKKMISEMPSKTLNEGLDYAAAQNAKGREHEDCIKGINAFLNKEKIQW